MSKCLKCGATLPPVGDCSACAITVHDTPVPSLLDRDIRIDRRTPERTAAVQPRQDLPAFADLRPQAPPPPSVAPLAAPLPPPAAPRAAAPQPGVAAPRPPAPQP
ncbi:RDD family protein, partial [Pyxidicoccus sp. QH1ED-7-1]|nr:RDD family protein [Pyxidicoccus xibeiensis]